MKRPDARDRFSLATIVAALTLGLFAPPTSVAAVSSERVSDSAGQVRDYWTHARMEAAEPIEAPAEAASPAAPGRLGATASASYVPASGEVARIRDGAPSGGGGGNGKGILPGGNRDEILDPSDPVVRPHGKVFFTIDSGEQAGDYVCSATAVNSKNKSVVWTAGHCVYPEKGSGFVTNWTFVPAYREGTAPFGEWPAKRLATTGPWEAAANIKYDLGAAVVRANLTGAKLHSVVGARGIGFDQPRDQSYQAFGYPAVAPPLEFTGEREFRCTSPLRGNDEPGTTGPETMFIDCDMTGGSSGGGWIAGSTLLSVTSYGYPLELDQLYGPYLSSSAKALYRGVRGGKPKPAKQKGPKRGRQASGNGKSSRLCPRRSDDGFKTFRLVGKTEERGDVIARRHDCSVRVVKRDGEALGLTDDLMYDRVNVVVVDGRITRIDGVY